MRHVFRNVGLSLLMLGLPFFNFFLHAQDEKIHIIGDNRDTKELCHIYLYTRDGIPNYLEVFNSKKEKQFYVYIQNERVEVEKMCTIYFSGNEEYATFWYKKPNIFYTTRIDEHTKGIKSFLIIYYSNKPYSYNVGSVLWEDNNGKVVKSDVPWLRTVKDDELLQVLNNLRNAYYVSNPINQVYSAYLDKGEECLKRGDFDEYMTHVNKTIDWGCDYAAFNTGYAYFYGKHPMNGVIFEKNQEKGIEYLRKASALGDKRATYLLGCFYLEGVSTIKKDPATSVIYFKKAVEQNSCDAMNMLAYCYARGDGTPQNFKLAHQTIDKAITLTRPNSWSIPFGNGLANYLDSKGEIYLMQGDKVNARKMWDKVIEQDPKWADQDTPLYQGLFK